MWNACLLSPSFRPVVLLCGFTSTVSGLRQTFFSPCSRRSLKGMGLGIDNEVMSEFHSADTNADGELQYDEFKRLVGHLTDDESLKA